MSMMQMLLGVGGALSDVYWWNVANSTGNVGCKAVAVDNGGNIYTAGAVTGYANGNICKFDKEGDMKWTYKGVYSTGESYYEDVAVDNLGHVYALCGSIGGTSIGQSGYTPMLIKLNTSDGSLAEFDGGSDDGDDWRKCFHTTYTGARSQSTGLTVDSSGNPIVSQGLTSTNEAVQAGVIKFNKDTGAATWVTRLQSSTNNSAVYMNEDGPGGLAIDSNDNVIVAGWRSASMGLTNGNYGIWVTKIAANGGSILYSRKFAATGPSAAQTINRAKCFVDSSDNVYINANWNDNTNDKLYTLVMKLDDELEVTWAKIIDSEKADGTHMKNASNYAGPGDVDKSGNVFVSAWISDCQSTNMGGTDHVICKLDSNGSNLEVVAIGNSSEDYPGGIAINKVGSIVIASQAKIFSSTSMNEFVAQLPGDMSITGSFAGHSTTIYVTKPSDESSNSTWAAEDVYGSGTYVLGDGDYTDFSYDDYSSEMSYDVDTATPGTGEDPGAPITIS